MYTTWTGHGSNQNKFKTVPSFAVGLGITLSPFHSFYRDRSCKMIKMIKWTSNITGNENMTLDATRRYSTLLEAPRRYLTLLDATLNVA
jgi:hypothetical protein